MIVRGIRIALGGALLVVLGAIEVHYYLGARAFFHPPPKPITDADRAKARALLPAMEEVSFRAADGVLLRGFYVPSKNGATVVACHGLTENRMSLVPTAAMLARHGYGALVFDLRAHGESEGNTSTWGDREQRDFAAAVDFASHRPDVHGGRIAALGFSIGATTVAGGAARDTRVRAVILDAVFTSFADEWKQKMGGRGAFSLWPAWLAAWQAGLDADNLRPIDDVARIAPRPLLFFAGTRDTDTPVAVVEKVFSAAKQPKELVVLEGVPHEAFPSASAAEYESRMVAFLERSLFGATASLSAPLR